MGVPPPPSKKDHGTWLGSVEITEYWPAPESWFRGALVKTPGLPSRHRIDWLYSAEGLSMEGEGIGLDGRMYHIDALGSGGWVTVGGVGTDASSGWSAGAPYWRAGGYWRNRSGGVTFPLATGGWSAGKGRRYVSLPGVSFAAGGATALRYYQSIAVDPSVIPLGSRVYVPAYRHDGHGGWFVAQDTGGAINGHHIDVYRFTAGESEQRRSVHDRAADLRHPPAQGLTRASSTLDCTPMAKQQRVMRVEQRSQLAAMQQMESRSDEELEAETKFKAAAQAILGARAAERYDAKAARAHFQRALAAARPQERLQLRRMADASLALAERRADDLKRATERLGVEAPSTRQLRGLKLMGLVAPPKSAGLLLRIRGIVIIVVAVIAILALGFGIVNLIALPFGGVSTDLGIFYGILLVAIVLGVLAYFGRRRQKRAQAERAEQVAARSR